MYFFVTMCPTSKAHDALLNITDMHNKVPNITIKTYIIAVFGFQSSLHFLISYSIGKGKQGMGTKRRSDLLLTVAPKVSIMSKSSGFISLGSFQSK